MTVPNKTETKTSIIVPVFNRADLTARFLLDFSRFCNSPDYELIISDDGSSDGTPALLQSRNITFQRNPENIGFPGTCNAGARLATGDVLIFVNNDVLIQGDFVGVLSGYLRSTLNEICGPQIWKHDTGWNCFDNVTLPYVAGWCLATTRFAWEWLGGFDERYAPYDYEDLDYSFAAVQAGFGIAEVPAPIQHMSGQSFPNHGVRRVVTERNRLKFAQKWGLTL